MPRRLAAFGLLLFAGTCRAQAAHDADALARQLSNPVASLISVPFQFNYDDGYANDGHRTLLNIQPVVPFDIAPEWNLISRTILPVVDQSRVVGSGRQSGLGDTVQSLFFSPKKPSAGGWIWGAGPVLLLPTATEHALGAEKWGLGPTAVALKQTADGWTYGALANHVWSVAGADDRSDVSSTFLQPFVAKGLGRGRTVTFNFEGSYDWKSRQWTLPLNAGVSQVMKWGGQLVSLQGGVRVYVERPDGGPDWGLRFALTLLFPR